MMSLYDTNTSKPNVLSFLSVTDKITLKSKGIANTTVN